jgi:hypothetical protein
VSLGQTDVVFKTSSRVISLRPLIFVKNGVILAVGSPPGEAADELPVFVANPAERSNRLRKFFSYALEVIIGRSFTIKPIVRVSNMSTTISFTEIREALIGAGAAEVTAA